jgi:hypothetical protein
VWFLVQLHGSLLNAWFKGVAKFLKIKQFSNFIAFLLC